MKLEELKIYALSMDLAEKLWNVVNHWDFFTRDTVGKQLIRAVDSIATNLSEGYGRYHYKENINFCYYSRGSLSETKTWLTKAFNRKLITLDEFNSFNLEIDSIGIKLNNYINTIGKHHQ